MVVVKVGVLKFAPVNKAVPPVAAANHWIVPALAVACKVTLPFPHLFAGVVPVIDGVVLTVATTAVLSEVQVPNCASTK